MNESRVAGWGHVALVAGFDCAAIRFVPPRWLLFSLFVHVLAFAFVRGPVPLKPAAPRLELRLMARSALPATVQSQPARVRPAPSRPIPVLASRESQTAALLPAAPAALLAPSSAVPAPASPEFAMAQAVPSASVPRTPSAPRSPAQVEDALAGYGAAFARWLAEHKDYPRLARMRGWQGQVRLRVRVARKGAVMEVEIARSSGFEVLDREAQAMVRRADPLPELPLSLAEREFTLDIPVVFRLEQPS